MDPRATPSIDTSNNAAADVDAWCEWALRVMHRLQCVDEDTSI